MILDADVSANRLFAALPEADRHRWLKLLEPVVLPLGRVLYEPGVRPSHVYFPTTAVVSLLNVLSDGGTAEAAVVGREGIVGICAFMGGGSSPRQTVVRSAGRGFRLKTSVMQEEFEHHTTVKHLVLRYTQALISQMFQTGVCNRHHSVDQRLCRCLLATLDRLHTQELVLTHELIARLLGVRRSSVTDATLRLQADGLIRYLPGHILVLDRPGLERRSCECHAVVKREYARLLPDGLGWPVSAARQWPPALPSHRKEAARPPHMGAITSDGRVSYRTDTPTSQKQDHEVA